MFPPRRHPTAIFFNHYCGMQGRGDEEKRQWFANIFGEGEEMKRKEKEKRRREGRRRRKGGGGGGRGAQIEEKK